ncbi:MAG TPA: phosphoribosyltransferase family protein [Longimicrobiales bacterium]|nr:phosphoribosyltransferase family protein [Longimicrobiales bacterium]
MFLEEKSPRRPEDFFAVSWEMFGELCRALALRVARDYEPEIVVGIARAGVVPAGVVSSILRTDLFAMTITRKEAGQHVRERPEVLSAAPGQLRGRRVLLVDEITTSGDTLRLALAAVRDVGPTEVRTATCFVRPDGFKPDYSALETDQELIFPWDRKVFQDGELVVNPRYEAVLDE